VLWVKQVTEGDAYNMACNGKGPNCPEADGPDSTSARRRCSCRSAATGVRRRTEMDPGRGGGLIGLRIADGTRAWSAPPPVCGDRRPCSPAQSAAVTAIAGVVFFTSGYGSWGGAPGNVLLAFSVDGR
jgi:hypothetical protein